MMRGYAETTGCRRQYLLAYFGEQLDEPCGHCDTCEAGTAPSSPTPTTRRSRCEARVEHTEWGEGLVMRYEGDRIVVLFDEVGYRTLLLSAVAAGGLLARAHPPLRPGLGQASWLPQPLGAVRRPGRRERCGRLA